MKRVVVALLFVVLAFSGLFAQKQITRTGTISFFSTTPVEDIEGINNQVTSILDTEGGGIVFAVLMKGFQFEKALMQEHFNEKYVESEKYPKTQFKGKIENLDAVDFSKDGTYTVTVSGPLSMHGETNEISTEGTIEIKEGKISAKAEFPITLKDYKINIPKLVADKIQETVLVNVLMNYDPFEKKK